jgi:GTPase SAR1 family protein
MPVSFRRSTCSILEDDGTEKYNILVLGNGGIGKSCMYYQYCFICTNQLID